MKLSEKLANQLSLLLLTLFFCFILMQAAGSDCMTSVLFYPLCNKFPPVFVSALMIGQTATNAVAAAIAAGQIDSSDGLQTRFGVDVFFYLLATVCFMSAVCALFIFAVERCYTSKSTETDVQKQPQEGTSTSSDDHTDDHLKKVCGVPTIVWSIFFGQALVSFVENGVVTSIAPSTLPYESSFFLFVCFR